MGGLLQELCVTCALLQDLALLHGAFDMRRAGNMAYMEFLKAVRGEMSVRRMLVVDRAYEKLDVNGDGDIDVKDAIARYNPHSRHEVGASGHGGG